MPGFTTHHVFGVNAFKKIKDKEIKDVIKKYHNSYALGLQGPDLFFYFMPTSSGIKPNIANKMHKEMTNEFMKQLILSCQSIRNNIDYHICTAYILGFMGHYLLDTTVHPYVYSRVGTKAGAEVLGVHFGLETDIDREVLMHYKNMKPTEFEHHKAVNVSSKEQEAIAKLLHKAIFCTYEIDISTTLVKAAIVSFRIESGLIMDKSSYKHKVINYIESHTIKYPFVSPLLVNDIKHIDDPCNDSHSEWKNPWDETKFSCDSVIDIMDRESDRYAELMKLMYDTITKVYNGQYENSPEILERLGNLSYTSGLDCTIPLVR